MDSKFKNSAMASQALEDVISSIPMPAHIKDSITGKYIISNQENLKVYSLDKTKEIIGKTVHDLDSFMHPYWGSDFAQKISDVDSYVIQKNKKALVQDHLLIARNGFIHIQDMIKTPITDNNNVTAIFTYTYDKTNHIDLLTLFKIYKNIYNKPHEANKIFCRYLQIDKFLAAPLTDAELMLLLSAKNCDSRNELANKICRSIKTVETHVTHINNKLIMGDFLKILHTIRSFEKSKEVNMENVCGNKKNSFNRIFG